ncbi:similar to Saccharomyces cerevisiae YDL113C ATG20 Sorting nexin family member required for the cytoplasm-to-vacuole targeting (Cvt) pathway and for endosomal sorting [Maudiozyma barnettii]|uniref:Autophagy-related protein 20 n=1 Tax=Maudiozyma barnettii TaxID=61262 RepID=A0A8H2VKK6_9SACH|nr:Atg20p [Kazachstania barnettii]CAB4257065.1 similar to Saccharomyces cerevisiae YDL113C ATG20 Sorting nexin family member required for the cytoplasm-to-vacuole targeting (Cvt) pathway and for endosomal sorting [Kazachstania barnettii]CAD1779436.1 similar to Saccharomyces cerevisiae YDL113C ATG20 Sorting nexin family member required for the cytoplasm-to-vacuole targeting (Cvt) pathway and for endosomal sorting [Kazachstania barnettii]
MAKNKTKKGKKQANQYDRRLNDLEESTEPTESNTNIDSSEGSPDQLVAAPKKQVDQTENKEDIQDIPKTESLDIHSTANYSTNSISDDVSLVEARMVHTAIIEKDNPFLEVESQIKKYKKDEEKRMNENNTDVEKHLSITQTSQNIKNPNKIYENDDDDLVLPKTKPLKRNDEQKEVIKSKSPMQTNTKDISKHSNGTKPSNLNIQILEANRISEGQGRAYVAYTIKYGDSIVKRRYSDFESLKNILIRLFPTTLIPPIPKKESIKTYGKVIRGSTNDFILPSDDLGSADLSFSVINDNIPNVDAKLIRHRIRMLTLFLTKVLQNKDISKTSIISDFLEPNHVNWNDFVASSPTFSSLPKNTLNCNPLDPTNTSRLYVSLPIPSSSQLIIPKEVRGVATYPKKVKEKFDLIDQDYKQYENILKNGIYKHNKRITKTFYDLKTDLNEIREISAIFAKSPQDIGIQEQLVHISDTYYDTSILLEKFVSRLHYSVDEPLSELVGMAGSARDLIKFRRLKYIQNDMIKKSLNSKQKQLSKLVAENSRFSHMDNAIEDAMANTQQVSLQRPNTEPNSYSGKLFSKFNKLASIVKESVTYQDIDPKTAAIEVKKEIERLEEFQKVTIPDLKIITDIIQKQELSEFENDRAQELKKIMKNHAIYMRSFAEKNLELWKTLKRQQTD